MEKHLLACRPLAVDTQQRPKKEFRPSRAEEGYEKKEVVSVNKSLMVAVVSRRNIEAHRGRC